MFIPYFSGLMLFRVQVFEDPDFSGSRFFRVRVFQGPGPDFRSSHPALLIQWFINFNDVSFPGCHTENLPYENTFILFKYSWLVFSSFYFFGHKYKGHNFLWAGAFAPVAPLSATRLSKTLVNCNCTCSSNPSRLIDKYFETQN